MMKSINKSTIPALPIPDPIRSDIPGTWAYGTMSERVVDIARRTLVENDFSAIQVERIRALIADIPQAPLRHLDQDGAADSQEWKSYTQPYLGQDWLEAPWFFTETYFYRRLLEATGYFGSGPGKEQDPFAFQKEHGLEVSKDVINTLTERLHHWLADGFQRSHLAALLAIDLWGNRADMSLWPADEGAQPSQADWEALEEHTLVDDSDQVTAYLDQNKGGQVDFIVDNAGLELVSDLVLADYLLATDAVNLVNLHLKSHPTFVSDAMKKDVRYTIDFLANSEDEATAAMGARLRHELANGRLALQTHPFWTSPLALWQMPPDLRQDLAQSTLIISKGDANYRRILGDRYWPYTADFQKIMAYRPAPFLALRSLKAELAAGLSTEQIERLDREDPDWMVNGRWGVIQFAP